MPSPSLIGGGAFGAPAVSALNSLISNRGILTQGNTYWVRPVNGSDQGVDGLSPVNAFQTLGRALAAASPNQNDVVLLCAENNTASLTTNYLTALLDWNKDGVHLIGVNGGAMISPRSRIANLGTAPSFANLFKVSANGCLIQGIEFFQGAGSNTLSAAQTCVLVSGQRNVFLNCMISGMGDTTLDYAGSNSLTITADENFFKHCYIGLDTVIRATSATEVVISGTPARLIFEDCHFETYTSVSTFKMITVPTGADRFVKFLDCDFHNVQNITSSTSPTGVIGITTMNGSVLVKNCYIYGFANIVTANNAYIEVLALLGNTASLICGIAQNAKVS